MRNLNNVKLFISVLLILSLLSCKRENPKEYKTSDLKNSLLPNGLPNITGVFNAYRYQQDVYGFVPLEIVEIKYYEESNLLIATKLLGDEAVLSGMETFRGYYTNIFFEVEVNGWSPQRQQFYKTTSDIVIKDENSFLVGISELKFLRRVSK